MKKILIIGGSIIGGLLALLLAAFIIFPGITGYIDAKKTYKYIDEPMAELEAVSPGDDFKEHSVDGIKIKVPGSWSENEGIYDLTDENGDGSITVMTRNLKNDEELFSGLIEDYDPWEGYEHEESEYRHFFESISEKVPQYGLSTYMIFGIRDFVTAKDCLKLRGKDREIFSEIAGIKDEAFESEDMWKFERPGFKAYVGHPKFEGMTGRIWNVNVFTEDDANDYFNVVLVSEDDYTAKQIINTIELDNRK